MCSVQFMLVGVDWLHFWRVMLSLHPMPFSKATTESSESSNLTLKLYLKIRASTIFSNFCQIRASWDVSNYVYRMSVNVGAKNSRSFEFVRIYQLCPSKLLFIFNQIFARRKHMRELQSLSFVHMHSFKMW